MIEAFSDHGQATVLSPVDQGLCGPTYKRASKSAQLKELSKLLREAQQEENRQEASSGENGSSSVPYPLSSVMGHMGVKRKLDKRDHLVKDQAKEISCSEKSRIFLDRTINFLLPPNRPREYKLIAFVTFLFLVIFVTFIGVDFIPEDQSSYIYSIKGLTLNARTLTLDVCNELVGSVLRAHVWRGANVVPGELPIDCSRGNEKDDGSICLLWYGRQRLHINQVLAGDNVTCVQIQWEALSPDIVQTDCFDLDDNVQWFGGGLINSSSWSLEQTVIPRKSFIVGDIHDPDSLGPILARYWITSQGVAIIVEEDVQLEISLNEIVSNVTNRQFCLFSTRGDTSNEKGSSLHTRNQTLRNNANLNYSICIGSNIRHIHETVLPRIVSEEMTASLFFNRLLITNPVWSTYAYFKNNLNQTALADYVLGMNKTDYIPLGLLMIDEGWEKQHGDMTFDPARFDDPTTMIKLMHDVGVNISIWQHSYVAMKTPVFEEASMKGYLVQDTDDDVPRLSRYWSSSTSREVNHRAVGIVDLMDEEAFNWQMKRIKWFVKKHDLNEVHFSGLEVRNSRVYLTLSGKNHNFNYFAKRCMELARVIGGTTSIQLAYRSQGQSPLVRLSGLTSNWTGHAGLSSVIPSALILGLIGYPLFIPDPVGGVANERLPSKELYLRWLQITIFFPILHFSIPHEHYDEETVAIVRHLMDIRRRIIIPELFIALEEWRHSLKPIIRPLWWIAPRLQDALTSSNQFLVGNNLMIAPILDEGHDKRDIFIPPGYWEDMISNNSFIYEGPLILRNYKIMLTQVAYFIRRESM